MSIGDTIDSVGDGLRGFLGGLTPRDRVLLGVMATALGLVLAWFAVGAMNAQTKGLQSQLASASAAQGQVNALMGRYSEIAGEVAGLDTRLAAGEGFSPEVWLEQLGKEMSIDENMKSILPRGVEEGEYYRAEKVEATVDDLDLRQLVKLLHKLQEAPQALRLTDIRVKTDSKGRDKLDVRFELAVLKPLGGA
jgi:type II secretory pathway component PulM